MSIGIGGLEQVENIAAGATATVYRAYDRNARRWVAVKVLSRSDEEFRRRFAREMRNLAQLTSVPGVAEVYDTGETDRGAPYLTMRYFDAGSLQDAIEATGELDHAAASEVMVAVSETVHQAHRLGIVHRDIKPANVLLDDTGRPHVADFGIARLFDESLADEPDIVTLAPAYAAPEVLGGQAADVAADVYALGATTYSAFSGLVPYADGVADAAQLMQRVQTAAVPELDPAVPPHVRQAVDFAMAKSPAGRPHSAAAFAAMLRSGAGGLSTRGRADLRLVGSEHRQPTSFVTEHVAMVQPNRNPAMAPSPTRPPKPAKRRPRAAVLMPALGLVALVGLVGFVLTQGDDPATTSADSGPAPTSLATSPSDTALSGTQPTVGGAVQVPPTDSTSTGSTSTGSTSTGSTSAEATSTTAAARTFDLEFLEDLEDLEGLMEPADTTVVDTSVPDTSVPDTSVPDTSVPDTSVPAASAPDTTVADPSLPETSVPDSSVPDSSAPDTSAPDSTVAGTSPEISGVFSLGVEPDGLYETVVVSWVHPGGADGFFVERQNAMGSFTWPEDGTLLGTDARTVTLEGEFETGSVFTTVTVVALVDGNQVRSAPANFTTQPQ